MITLISPAKTMRTEVPPHTLPSTSPLFGQDAYDIARELKGWSAEDWQSSLKLSPQLSAEVVEAYSNFETADTLPAVMGYDGIVFKYLKPSELSSQQLSSLRICSFLYGLLRPTDAIASYRLEGNVKLQQTNHKSLFAYWKPKLTELLLQELTEDEDHTLLFLGSEEMKKLFDWRRIQTEFRIIQPLFLQQHHNKLKQIVVHTKMYRGTMTQQALREGWHGSLDELMAFAQHEEMELTEGTQPGVYNLIIRS